MELDADAVRIIRDLIEIAFFVLAGTIALCTYLQARKTVLQPMKTETFKAQLALLDKVALFFCGKIETQLRDSLGFKELSRTNAMKLVDDFAEDHSDKKIDRATRPYSQEDIALYDLNLKSPIAEDYVLPFDGTPHTIVSTGDRKRQRDWDAYVWEEFYYPAVFQGQRMKLAELASSPLLPVPVLKAVTAFQNRVEENIQVLKDVLDSLGREWHRKIQDGKTLALSWMLVHNQFSHKFIPFDDVAEEVTRSIRAYTQASKVLD